MIQHIKRYYVKYIISTIVGLGIVLLACILQNDFTSIVNYMNGFFVGGFSLICVGGLSWCQSVGAYDMFSYMFAKRGPNGVKPTLYDYSEAKKEKRRKSKLTFLPYIIVGIIFVVICFILYIFY